MGVPTDPMLPIPPTPPNPRRRRRLPTSAPRLALLLALGGAGVMRGSGPRPIACDSPAELARFTRSNNALGVDLYQRLRTRPGNIALSPLSVTSGLTMLWAGAGGETGVQIQKVLHAEGTADAALGTVGQVGKSLSGWRRKFTFHSADRLFVEKTHAAEPVRLARLGGPLADLIEPAELGSAPEAGRRRINDWVAAHTEHQIRALLPPDAITPATTFVVASANYLHAGWKERFPPQDTGTGPFFTTPTESREVPMMHRKKAAIRLSWDNDVSVLELPYEGEELAMLLVLPQAAHGLEAVEARLTPGAIDAWAAALRPSEKDIILPRFELTSHLSLTESLKALGMPLGFDPGAADFSGIAARGVALDRFEQETHLKVDEAGTVAWTVSIAFPVKAAPDELLFDQPFLFFVREMRSGLILFMGRVSDPAAP